MSLDHDSLRAMLQVARDDPGVDLDALASTIVTRPPRPPRLLPYLTRHRVTVFLLAWYTGLLWFIISAALWSNADDAGNQNLATVWAFSTGTTAWITLGCIGAWLRFGTIDRGWFGG